MDEQTSHGLQHRLTELLCRARRLREESDRLNQEILRVSQLIAGVAPAESEQASILDDDWDFAFSDDLPADRRASRIASDEPRFATPAHDAFRGPGD